MREYEYTNRRIQQLPEKIALRSMAKPFSPPKSGKGNTTRLFLM
jgi:hypothetical protein